MAKSFPGATDQNLLLCSLSAGDRAEIEPHLARAPIQLHQIIEVPDRPVITVVFPISGVGSTIALGVDGRRIEAGLFGREGMSGSVILMGGDRSPNETVMQLEGEGLYIDAGRLRDAMDARPTLRAQLLRYLQVLLVQTGQTALSNGHSRLEERLARWLLMCHDRIDGNTLEITHEYLSIMLGVRRAGVTVGTHLLEGKGLIRATRGSLTILHREGLEAEAGTSYGIPEREYLRLFA